MFTNNPYKIPRTVVVQMRMWINSEGGVKGETKNNNNTLPVSIITTAFSSAAANTTSITTTNTTPTRIII